MTRAEFQALFPEFAASTYNARIDTLLGVVPAYSAAKLGNQLNLATGLWLADMLANQDITITYGAAAAASASSTSTEEKVGDVSYKTALSQSASSGTSGGTRPGRTTYGARLAALLIQKGAGALVSPGVAAVT